MSEILSAILTGLIIGLLVIQCISLVDERDIYKAEVMRQNAVIKEQHGKMHMLDGILRNEIDKFTLEWVDLGHP